MRYSVTMDDTLTDTIDKSCEKRKISRSDWISEACHKNLAGSAGTSTVGAPALPSAGPVFGHNDHNMSSYDEMYQKLPDRCSRVLQLRF